MKLLYTVLLEKFGPLVFGQRVMEVEPGFERAEFFLQFENFLRVDNCRIDLQPVADDSRVGKQAGAGGFVVLCHLADVESAVGFVEVIRFFEDGDPRQPRLVDFQNQPLEEFVIAFDGEPVQGVVVGYVESVFGV